MIKSNGVEAKLMLKPSLGVLFICSFFASIDAPAQSFNPRSATRYVQTTWYPYEIVAQESESYTYDNNGNLLTAHSASAGRDRVLKEFRLDAYGRGSCHIAPDLLATVTQIDSIYFGAFVDTLSLGLVYSEGDTVTKLISYVRDSTGDLVLSSYAYISYDPLSGSETMRRGMGPWSNGIETSFVVHRFEIGLDQRIRRAWTNGYCQDYTYHDNGSLASVIHSWVLPDSSLLPMWKMTDLEMQRIGLRTVWMDTFEVYCDGRKSIASTRISQWKNNEWTTPVDYHAEWDSSGRPLLRRYGVNLKQWEYYSNGGLREEIVIDTSNDSIIYNRRLTRQIEGDRIVASFDSVRNWARPRFELQEFWIYDYGKNDVVSASPLQLQPVIYPNPSCELTRIEHSDRIIRLSVADAQGRIVLRSEPNSSTTTIDVKHLSTGIYTLQVIDDTGPHRAQFSVMR